MPADLLMPSDDDSGAGGRGGPDRRYLRRPSRAIRAVGAVVAAVLAAGCSNTPQTCSLPGANGSVVQAALSPTLGTKTDWSRLGAMRHYLQSLGGGVTFYEVAWCDIEETPGVLDWSSTDTVVEQARSVGFTTLIKIRVGQCRWVTGKPPSYLRGKQQKTESAMPHDMLAYAGFVKRVVERYSAEGVQEYAVENEVNSVSFWDGTSDEYRRLVTVAARVVRNVDPEAEVVDAGMSSVASGYGVVERLLRLGRIQAAVDTYNIYFSRRIGTRGLQIVSVDDEAGLQQALDSEQGRRNLEFLAVTNRLVADHVVDVRQVHFYEEWSALPFLMDYLRAMTPPTTPLEMWEIGSYLGDMQLSETRRTADMVKAVAVALSQGVTKVVWIPLNVDSAGGSDDERLSGLLSPSGQEQPASRAYAAMSRAAKGGRPVALDGHGIVGLAFDEDAHSTAFVWSGCSPVSVSLPPGSRVGEPATTSTTGRGHAWVGHDPVKIELPIPAETFMETLE